MDQELPVIQNTDFVLVNALDGILQDEVLSPLLWCLIVVELIEVLNDMGFKAVGCPRRKNGSYHF